MDKKDIKLEALKKKLTEIFQLDKADLDFGIYRILNQKRKDVEHFIQTDLPEIVNEELVKYDSGKNVELQSELDNAMKNAKDLGVDPESTDKVKELRSQLKDSVSKDDIEAEVYSALTDFFSRYYDEGDFISQRRYKDGVYAIPYEGEEVKLYWANADQYYIKTTEDFANFSFYIDEAQIKRVSFQIVKAETEKDNNKEADSKKRRFVLVKEAPVEIVDDTLVIRFTYEVSNSKQEILNQQAEEQVKQLLPQEFAALFAKAPTDKDKNRSVFGKWLGHYTSKNTFDYFIHKDLKGFLSRELDFYIKNELLRIDDLDAFAVSTNSKLISKIKVFKHIAESIVSFLAQLENLQKLLWEKKKFVTESDYLVSINYVDSKFYEDISNNELQVNQWKELGLIGHSEIISAEYLNLHKTLVIDTNFFAEIKDSLLENDLESKITGLLINSDNFGALTTISTRYESQIKCVYIDPPYNTDSSEIIYKNGYKHSSWLSLIHNRVSRALPLMSRDSIFEFAIDNEEQSRAEMALSSIFGSDNFISKLAVLHNPKGRDKEHFADSHEYLIVYAKDKRYAITNDFIHTDGELLKKYPNYDGENHYRLLPLKRTGSESKRSDRPYMFFPIFSKVKEEEVNLYLPTKDEVSKIYTKENGFNDDYLTQLIKTYTQDGYGYVTPQSQQGEYLRWRWGYDSIFEGINTKTIIGRLGRNNVVSIFQKDVLDDKYKPKTFWIGEKYDASSKGTNYLKDLFPENNFDYPKSIHAMEDAVYVGTHDNSTVLDFFGGSGTTADAVIKLNRRFDKSNRKFIVVEMGSYFNTVTKPRLQKISYSNNWSNGKPQDEGATGSPQVIKYIKLESYEDALNNLKFSQQTDTQRSFLDNDKALERNYRINYMLNFESQDSTSLLDIKQFDDPFSYEMLIQDDANRLVPKNIDLVDTFNYLIGLRIDHIEKKKGFVVVQGKQNDGTRTLIIWRNVKENTNEKLNEFLEKSDYNPKDGEFDVIYVNGDNNVENLQTSDDAWKVRLIEEEFHKRMFN